MKRDKEHQSKHGKVYPVTFHHPDGSYTTWGTWTPLQRPTKRK